MAKFMTVEDKSGDEGIDLDMAHAYRVQEKAVGPWLVFTQQDFLLLILDGCTVKEAVERRHNESQQNIDAIRRRIGAALIIIADTEYDMVLFIISSLRLILIINYDSLLFLYYSSKGWNNCQVVFDPNVFSEISVFFLLEKNSYSTCSGSLAVCL